ncbi:MAG: glycosyltransferase [Steroidobacteraceae bacterium]
MHVAVMTDAAYVMPLGTMLTSLCQRLDPAITLCVHVLGDRLTSAHWLQLEACVAHGNVSLHRLDLDGAGALGPEFRTRAYEHLSLVTFLRLLLPDLLPQLERVLYLDCDLIVCADVHELWQEPLQGACFGAAIERDARGTPIPMASQLRDARSLGVSEVAPLFNMGVMLIDLAAWRRTRLAERAFAYLRAAGPYVLWYDQDALNVCAQGNVLTLAPRWNSQPALALLMPASQRGCIHYLTARKPWNWDYDQPLREPFFAAIDAGPLRGWRPARPRFGHLKALWRRLRKAGAKRVHALRRLAQVTLARRATPGTRDGETRIITTAGTWRVLLRAGEVLCDVDGRRVEPAAAIARCEADAHDAIEAQRDDADVIALEGWAACDARTGALFLGRARVLPPVSASAAPRFVSRIVIVRDQPGIRLDAAQHVIAGARVAPGRLRLTPGS